MALTLWVVYLLVSLSPWIHLEAERRVRPLPVDPSLLLCICAFLPRAPETSEKRVELGETQIVKQTNAQTMN